MKSTLIISLSAAQACKKLVYYWGQNSYGASHLDQKQQWEKDLAHYCSEDVADIFMLSFLNVFNAGNGRLPEVNFANHCEYFFNATEASTLRHCPEIGRDIPVCQKKHKKTLLLSLGGAIGSVGFQSQQEAQKFAKTVWDLFLGGNHKFRPFGKAVLDGVDLDIEGGQAQYYDVFVKAMRELYSTDKKKKYYIGAAPQCEFPDRLLSHALNNAWFDFVFIQFYNNWCGVQNYDNKNAWNYPVWDKWAQSTSINKDVQLYLGIPASQTAAGSGYTTIEKLSVIIKDLSNYKSFAGVMMWDASQAGNNVIGGKNFGKIIKEKLNTGCGKYNSTIN